MKIVFKTHQTSGRTDRSHPLHAMSNPESEYLTLTPLDFEPTDSQRTLLDPTRGIQFNWRRSKTYDDDVVEALKDMFQSAFGALIDPTEYLRKVQLKDGIIFMGKLRKDKGLGAEHFAIVQHSEAASGFVAYHIETLYGRGAAIYDSERTSWNDALAYIRKCSTNPYCADWNLFSNEFDSDDFDSDGGEEDA